MTSIELTYLSGPDVDALALTDDEILASVRDVLAEQGRGETVIEPRTHLFPRRGDGAGPGAGGGGGHFNVLRGATAGFAGVKVVGDFVDNHRLGLPSELALLLLMDPATGVPAAIVDATAITEMRTGAVTAIGAEHLARRDARVLGHVGARGTAYWNVRLLCRVLPELVEIRVHSRRPESRAAFAQRLSFDLGREVSAVAGWEQCVRGADVVVEASRLGSPEPLLATEWISSGALVIPYGTVSAWRSTSPTSWTRSWLTTGVRRASVPSGPCAPTSTRAGCRSPTCTPSWARWCAAPVPAASATPRRSCSGTAACPSLTSLSVRRCSKRRWLRAWVRACPIAAERGRSSLPYRAYFPRSYMRRLR